MLTHKKCGKKVDVFRMIGLGQYQYAYWFCCMTCNPENMLQTTEIEGLQ